jgi:ABC-type multidrug transport system ATPase subunit/pSer/pThr/pTyr-binding forkhead associated (FHA) protein
VLADDRVSWAHGELSWTGAAWTYTDLGSSNGSFLDTARVDQVDIADDRTIRLASPDRGPALSCVPAAKHQTREPRPVPAQRAQPAGAGEPPSAGPRKPASVTSLPLTQLRIGRAEDNEVVLRDELVSRQHAELRRTSAGYVIEDLGSRNGVFVNGAKVSSSLVTERDIIAIGRSTFRLVGGGLHEFVDSRGAALMARDLVVTVQRGKKRGQRLLDGVTFAVPRSCLVAVVGPSGAGKSTLVKALTGKRPADGGTVLYEDRDLYKHYAELRLRIGHVPQEDILHTQLTAQRALRYSAELRFDPDFPAAERDDRVDDVLRDLGLADDAGKKVGVLSGGQRKRVNMAPELLARPSLLVLDEPTSGLDPNLDQSVMQELHRLAHRGMTIIVVTHNVMHLEECDQLLIMAPKGRVAFYGPPSSALGYFRAVSWTEVFQGFEDEEDRDWAGEFRQSPFYAEPVGEDSYPSARRGKLSELTKPRPDWLRQAATLTRRYAQVSWSDRSALADMAVLPLVVGALIRFFPLKQGLAGVPGTNVFAQEVLEIMVTSACLAGAAASIRELVKERPIYERERAAGLSSRGYLVSKLALLSVISIVQSVAMVLLGLAGRRMPAHGVVLVPFPLLELLIATAVLAVASTCVGLLVSAFVSTSEKAMQFLVSLTMAQVILSGGLLPLAGRAGLDWLSWIVPARWGLAAMASTVNLNSLNPPSSSTDPLWAPTMVGWLRDIAVALAISALCVVATWARLRRLDPSRR